MKKISICLMFVILFVQVVFAADKIVAVVNDDIITEVELEDYLKITGLNSATEDQSNGECNPEERKKALESLIEDKLIVQQARAQQIIVPSQMVEERLEDFIAQFKQEKDFQDSLAKRGLNIADLKKRIEGQILMKQIINFQVRRNVQVYPAEITAFYNKNKAKFDASPLINYKGLKFASQTQALQAYEKMANSSVPGQIIGEYPENIIEGSLSQKQARQELVNLFEKEQGQITEPIAIDKYYYIFWIKEKNPSRSRSLPEVKDRIWQIIYQTKFAERFIEWVNGLKEDAIIEIVDPGC